MANTFAHVELNTSNPVAAKEFYRKIFAWKMQDMEMGPGMFYTMVDTGSRQASAGLQQKPMPDAPNAWLPYVEVASVKKTIEKAKALGAQIIISYQPLPDMGVIGLFLDPTGAALGIWEKEKKPVKKPAHKKAPKKAKRGKK
jgi:uncharacterized protein